MRAFPLLLAALLAACGPTAGPSRPAPAAPTRPEAAFCRIGPDGGPPLPLASADAPAGDRGIGGTGVLAENTSDGDRGIGGTGALAGDPSDDDRGIGGTGIVGVVTGFASVCINGLRVSYAPDLRVTLGDRTVGPDALRVGQVVAIEAAGRDGGLRARRLSVRQEVVGPVQAMEAGALRVAGQRVTTAGAVGGAGWRVGDVVAVSGLRGPDGSIAATRIEPRPAGTVPGAVTIHGTLTRRGGIARVGDLPIRPDPALALPPDGAVIATGRIVGDALVADSVRPDLLARDLPAWFGPGVGRFVVEGYVSLGDGLLSVGPGLAAAAPAGAAPFAARRGIVELRRGEDRRLVATGLRDAAGSLPSPSHSEGSSSGLRGERGAPSGAGPSRESQGPRGDIAPMPDRSFEARQGHQDSGNRGGLGGRGGDGFRGRGGGAQDRTLDGLFGQGSGPGRPGPAGPGRPR